MSAWFTQLTDWLAAHPHWLGLALFTAACIECLAILGLLIPGTVVLFSMAMLAGHSGMPLWQTLLLGYTGGLLGDAISYGLGRRYHGRIRALPGLRQHPQWLATAEMYFRRYGVVSLLVGRYIGPLRPMLPMVAGMFEMPLGRFMLISLLAASGWAVAYLLPGWATGTAMRLPLPSGFWHDVALILGGVVAVLGVIIHSSLRGRRQTTLLAAGACLLPLVALLLGWQALDHLDQGLMTVIQAHRHSAMDHVMVLVTRLGDFRTQLIAGVLLVGLLALTRQWRAALFATGVLLGTALSNVALKWLLARARPDILLAPLPTFSLPSGHTSAAFAFFLTLGILAGRGQPVRWRLTWLLLVSLPAMAIAFSRVYLGVHWPTDILAGALLAGTLCAASLALVQRHTPLTTLPPRVWRIILPPCLGVLAAAALWNLAPALQRYAY